MNGLWLDARSLFLWVLSIAHFFPITTLLIVLGAIIPPKRFDPIVRLFFRNVIRIGGARLEVVRAPGFDAERTCLFVANHVNLFDPMVVYSSIPQFLRGLELESHFDIPVYGWMMKRFGNVPVPDRPTSASLKRMKSMTRTALENGTSLIVFPEGSRTLDGRVGKFHTGAFRMAQEFGTPLVPVSISGSFAWKRKTSWRLGPARIVVTIHAPIEPEVFRDLDIHEFRDLARAQVESALDASGDPRAFV